MDWYAKPKPLWQVVGEQIADIPALNDESTAGTTIWIQIQAALCVGERESVCAGVCVCIY